MNRRTFLCATMLGASQLTRRLPAQRTTALGALADTDDLRLVNRTASRHQEGDREILRLSEGVGDGLALLRDVGFDEGAISLELRGRNVPQRSFVGVAFHATDGAVYEAVYFRPFNFMATDPVSRSHAVQFHALPGFGWQRLRTLQPGKYEAAVTPIPDPDGWFTARIEVASPRVRVFVNDATTPSLEVDSPSDRRCGLVGCGSATTLGATSRT